MEKTLNGYWDLIFFEQDSFKPDKPSELKKYYKSIQCSVPGNVELDLSEAGFLPKDLFMGENLLSAEKFETYEWWYHKSFALKKGNDRLYIMFEGVDCFAEYYVNDVYIGKSENMLIPQEFDITDAAVDGQNELYVRIRSSLLEENKIPSSMFSISGMWRRENDHVNARKAPHMYGWDIMPRAISAGIWRGVFIKTYPDAFFKQLYLVTLDVEKNNAKIQVNYELNIPQEFYNKEKQIKIEGICGDSKFEKIININFKAGNTIIDIENPMLWWPHGYGKANLYDVTVTFLANGIEVCKKSVRFGLRTVKLDRTDVTDGKNGKFRFLINGTEIMAKGSNWVPLDVYHSRDNSRYDMALSLVKDIGCNILRCWGGNVYEEDKFFDFCDDNGIMIWQDFTMACYTYPRTEEFCRLMKEEAETIIKRLRQHPSIILWSGDNEGDIALDGKRNPNLVNKVTREILQNAVIDNDYLRPYLPSSPFISESVFASGNFDMVPEDHLWGPRDYYKSDFYQKSNAHFISETGYHGCPCPESIKKFINKESLWPIMDNREWNFHSTDQNNNPERVLLMVNQIKQMFGEVPDNLEEFSLLSQFSQAEAKKYFIERVRIDRPNKTGIIWWNLLDGWPQMSDAVVDYYFEKKIAYYYIKNSQQPFCIFCDEIKDGKQKIVASNDTLQQVNGYFKVYNAETDELLLKGDISVKENRNELLGEIDAFYSEKRLLLIEWEVNGKTGKNHYTGGLVPFDKELYKKWYNILKDKNYI